MSAQPPVAPLPPVPGFDPIPSGKPWLDSNAVRSLIGAALLCLLAWLGDGIAMNSWDWRDLARTEIPILVFFVKRLADPDVVAPLDSLNFRNPRRLP